MVKVSTHADIKSKLEGAGFQRSMHLAATAGWLLPWWDLEMPGRSARQQQPLRASVLLPEVGMLLTKGTVSSALACLHPARFASARTHPPRCARRSELERLRRENAALRRGASSGIRMKVSEKGAVSIYGMGRFPVTLYKEQWLKLLDMAAEIRAFIAANESQLKAKE
jgi:hypothetical protein